MNTEKALYAQEGLDWTDIAFKDNAPTIAVLTARQGAVANSASRGVLPLLDEECRQPKGSDANFAKAARATLQEAGHEQSHTASRSRVAGVRTERARATLKAVFEKRVPYFNVTSREVKLLSPPLPTTHHPPPTAHRSPPNPRCATVKVARTPTCSTTTSTS